MRPLFLLIVFLGSMFCAHAQPAVGSPAPDISLPDSKGEVIKLSSLKGKVVLLDFWASWCAPCRQSNRKLAPVYNRYKEKGLEILGVSIDGNRSAWENAVRLDKTGWLQVIDEKAERGNEMTKTWNLRYIPSNFLLDKEGRIVAEGVGKDDLEQWLKRLL